MSKLIQLAKISLVSLVVLFGLVLLGLSLPFGGRRMLSVQTGSMQPAIPTGSMVWVNKVPVSKLAAGDVITYINPANSKQTITHRIVEIAGRQNGPKEITTKGDANPTADEPISQNRVVGRVGGSVPYVGRALDFLRTWPGLIALVYIPALVVIVFECRKLMEYYKSQEPYIVPELLARRKAGHHVGRSAVIVVMVGVFSLAIAVPAYAAFKVKARLTGNTITAKGDDHHHDDRTRVKIANAFVACDSHHHHRSRFGQKTKKLFVELYNARHRKASVGDWYLTVRGERLFTFPDHAVIWGHDDYDLKLQLPHWLDDDARTIKLRKPSGEVVDQERLGWSKQCQWPERY